MIGTTLAHYEVTRLLGQGGMATVYLAEDLKHHRQVALKIMLPELALAIGHDRFLREIETAARLNHPHILPLYDSGAESDQLYYVMPYIAGGTLRNRMDSDRQLPLEEALRLTKEIASALGHAHAQGLVHRDIKPENVLLADGLALVADFGIVRAATESGLDTRAPTFAVTAKGSILGTPRYMSPEQASGGNVDTRADLYALTCVLYEMLAGQAPFEGPTADSLIRMHLTAAPRPITDIRPNIPTGVTTAITRGLAKVPADRFESAARFAEALSVGVAPAPTPTPTPEGKEEAAPSNLPKIRTHFIGRKKELAECARILGETRLLTLTGVGGSGKTRLALKLADSMLSNTPDGVWFVDLAPLPDPDRVPEAIAKALGLTEIAGTPILDTLIKHLAPKQAIIVLDNCEHLIGATSEITDQLLATSDQLRIIATSREGLGVEGESTYSLRSLSVPKREDANDLQKIGETDSVSLFVDRARAVDARFQLMQDVAPAVAEICRRLDGIPLAIELAAARTKLLSVDEINARLDDRFRLLTGGSKSALPRHQTLRATIAWSYEHLTEEEKQLFRLLAVFKGGWTLAAATAVADENADDFETLELLGHLVDKSLVLVDKLTDGTTRYSMLETVRQYAQEHLTESGEMDTARNRHLDFFLGFVETGFKREVGGIPEAVMDQTDRDLENIILAFEWCDRAEGGGEKGLRLINPMSGYWEDRGLYELGLRLNSDAIARPGAQERTKHRARGLLNVGRLEYRMGRFDVSRPHQEESLEISRELDDRVAIAAVLNWLGHIPVALGDLEEGRKIKLEGLKLSRELGDDRSMWSALTSMGELERQVENYDEAEPYYIEALEIVRRASSWRSIKVGLCNLASNHLLKGNLSEAHKLTTEVFEVGSENQDSSFVHNTLDVVGPLASAMGDPATTARFGGFSISEMERMGVTREPVDEKFFQIFADKAREELGEEAYAAAEASGRELSMEQALKEAKEWLEKNSSR